MAFLAKAIEIGSNVDLPDFAVSDVRLLFVLVP
jgi:hypothetical protein